MTKFQPQILCILPDTRGHFLLLKWKLYEKKPFPIYSFPHRKRVQMGDKNEMKNRIIEGGMNVYRRKGPKFTMDDLAAELSMSKKTIYVVYRDKKALLYDMVEYTFDAIKHAEQEIMDDMSLDTREKVRGILGVMPENFREIDFTMIDGVRDKYPEVFVRINERLEGEWETTISLLKQGMDEGVFKDFNITVFKITYEAAIERFLHRDELKSGRIKYMDALGELVDIMLNGISAR